MKKLKWWQIGLGVIVVNILLPYDKKIWRFHYGRGMEYPLFNLKNSEVTFAHPDVPA